MSNQNSRVLTMDDLESKKRLAHYQSVLEEAQKPRNWALDTLAHYQALLVKLEASGKTS